MSYTVREFSHAAKKVITVAVAKVPWENIISVSLRRNPWNKVLSSYSELRKHQIVI